MRVLILISFLLYGCDQSVNMRNNGNDNKLLGSLFIISNSGNSNSVTNVTNTSGGGTVTTTAGVTTYTLDGVTYTANPSSGASSSALTGQISRFLLGTFIIDTPSVPINTGVNYIQNESACNAVGYRPVTLSEFRLFVDLIEFARVNNGKVPTQWMSLSDRFMRTDGFSFWITDRDLLFSNDLAYRITLRKTYSGMFASGSFYYANERMDNVYNKNSIVGAVSLICYRIN